MATIYEYYSLLKQKKIRPRLKEHEVSQSYIISPFNRHIL